LVSCKLVCTTMPVFSHSSSLAYMGFTSITLLGPIHAQGGPRAEGGRGCRSTWVWAQVSDKDFIPQVLVLKGTQQPQQLLRDLSQDCNAEPGQPAGRAVRSGPAMG
jgi:hypothetical protein